MGSWWEGIDESRLLIAPDPGANENGSACLLSLRHPKSGNRASYLLCNGLLQELHWFKQPYGSWFLGDYVSEDGSLYTATPIDPVFIMLPIFEDARMKKGDDPGKFRQLEEILFVNDCPGYRHLFSMAEDCMEVVCEIKEVGSTKFFRLDDTKVLAWLLCKVSQLKQTLPALDQNYAAREEKDTCMFL
ncbi:ribonuclease H2 subunit B-like isoform X2 [Hibiscus syriacus]|uniref:ribonuclease H2 subunit B-like isoform X2 n=1 Tax=Hibiscus syriacus TaxID=106335 RepID=UPI001924688A|nr:ribonuclease H2 subunit B-like isoform X2 [Hibiscus syriacus]